MAKAKLCKYCKMEIPKGAKVCPHCRKRQKGGVLKWIVIVVVVIGVIGAAGGGGSENKTAKTPDTSKTTAEKPVAEKKQDEVKAPEPVETEAPIEYTVCTVNQMMEELDANPLSASEKYKNQYIEVTGKLSVIDSSGKYISLFPDKEFALTGVQCDIKNDEQKSAVAAMQKGQMVTVRGKCTLVGEVIGYSLDIDEIVQ